MKPWEVIEQLDATPSRTNKEAILLSEAKANNDELFAGFMLAYNSFLTFGLKQIPEATVDGPGIDWFDFLNLTDQLIDRKLTGNAARDAVEVLMKKSTVRAWNKWFRPILIRDMRCSTSDSTVNKVAKKSNKPEYAIPLFEVQLAFDGANHAEKIVGKKIIQSKLDGVRLITIVYPTGVVEQFTRNGKVMDNFPHIRDQFASVADKIEEPWVFDGEIMSSSFQDLMKQTQRKSNIQTKDSILNLFDCLSLVDFKKGICTDSQVARAACLDYWYNECKDKLPNVNVLGYEIVDLNTDIGQKRFNEINNLAIAAGFEGILIKDPNAPYECKRSVAWLKRKPFITVDLTVVGIEEGTGKYEKMMGALVCEGTDQRRLIQVNVGSGFTDEERDIIWNNQSNVLNQIVEIKADVITKNQNGTYSLRFPRFERWRGFEPGEKM